MSLRGGSDCVGPTGRGGSRGSTALLGFGGLLKIVRTSNSGSLCCGSRIGRLSRVSLRLDLLMVRQVGRVVAWSIFTIPVEEFTLFAERKVSIFSMSDSDVLENWHTTSAAKAVCSGRSFASTHCDAIGNAAVMQAPISLMLSCQQPGRQTNSRRTIGRQ